MKKLIADSTLTVELPESRKTVKEKVNSDTDSENDTHCRLIAKGRKALHAVWNCTNSLLHIICTSNCLSFIYTFCCFYVQSYTPRQILGTTMAQFLVNIATAEEFGVQATHPTDQPDVPQQCWKIQGTSINISFGSVGYAHFLTQFCERVSSTMCSSRVAVWYPRCSLSYIQY